MANGILFFTRPGKRAEIPVYIRVRLDGKDYMSRIPDTTTSVEDWPEGKHAQHQIRKVFPHLGTIATALEEAMKNGTFTKALMDGIIEKAVYGDSRDKARARLKQAEEEMKQLSLLGYYDKFLKELRDGVRKSDKGVIASPRTITNYQQGYNRLTEFQDYLGEPITWEMINRDFLSRYILFLQSSRRGLDAYNTNTCSKRIKEIKHIIRAAREEGVTTCPVPEFKFGEVAVDSVYLTWDEIARFAAADLSGLSKGHEIARDLFLVGCYCGQRVSDYASIKSDQIHTDSDGRVYISVLQKKTGTKVEIPVRKELREILAKYNNELPTLADQKINAYIKEIAKVAGIDEAVEYTSTKGGKAHTIKKPKYELITSHTARRTAATLMYLDGVDSMRIRQITGHSSDKMLQKYIRSTAHDNARMMARQYSFFD